MPGDREYWNTWSAGSVEWLEESRPTSSLLLGPRQITGGAGRVGPDGGPSYRLVADLVRQRSAMAHRRTAMPLINGRCCSAGNSIGEGTGRTRTRECLSARMCV